LTRAKRRSPVAGSRADVWEGVRGIDRQRRQHGEDLVHEPLPQLVLALRPVFERQDTDAFLSQLHRDARKRV